MGRVFINPFNSPGEGVNVFTYPYLSVGAPAFGEVKGLTYYNFIIKYKFNNEKYNI